MKFISESYVFVDNLSDVYIKNRYPHQYYTSKDHKQIINWCKINELEPPVFYYQGSSIFLCVRDHITLIQIVLVFGND